MSVENERALLRPRSSLSVENERADARRDGRTRLTRPNSQPRIGTEKKKKHHAEVNARV